MPSTLELDRARLNEEAKRTCNVYKITNIKLYKNTCLNSKFNKDESFFPSCQSPTGLICTHVMCWPDSLLYNKEDIIHHTGCDSLIITTLCNIHLHSLTEKDTTQNNNVGHKSIQNPSWILVGTFQVLDKKNSSLNFQKFSVANGTAIPRISTKEGKLARNTEIFEIFFSFEIFVPFDFPPGISGIFVEQFAFGKCKKLLDFPESFPV